MDFEINDLATVKEERSAISFLLFGISVPMILTSAVELSLLLPKKRKASSSENRSKQDDDKKENDSEVHTIAPATQKRDPKTLKEKIDSLLKRYEAIQQVREKERILSKIDGLFTLLIRGFLISFL
jgi:hypothetical protein